MKIIKREENKLIFFDEILKGDVFTLDGKDFFIKTDLHSLEFYVLNAISLKDGMHHCFDADTAVIPVDCELVINGNI